MRRISVSKKWAQFEATEVEVAASKINATGSDVIIFAPFCPILASVLTQLAT